MAEYIERGALLSMVRPDDPSDEKATITIATAKELIRSLVYRVPAADVAHMRHGMWISLTECANEGVYCSICKKKVWKSDYALCKQKSRNKLRSNYCPNCGCRMDGGTDE